MPASNYRARQLKSNSTERNACLPLKWEQRAKRCRAPWQNFVTRNFCASKDNTVVVMKPRELQKLLQRNFGEL